MPKWGRSVARFYKRKKKKSSNGSGCSGEEYSLRARPSLRSVSKVSKRKRTAPLQIRARVSASDPKIKETEGDRKGDRVWREAEIISDALRQGPLHHRLAQASPNDRSKDRKKKRAGGLARGRIRRHLRISFPFFCSADLKPQEREDDGWEKKKKNKIYVCICM